MPLCPSANLDSVSLSQESMNRRKLRPHLTSLSDDQFEMQFVHVIALHPIHFRANGRLLIYNLEEERSVLPEDGTNRAHLQQHDPLPRVPFVATSTDEEQLLPAPLDELHAEYNATRDCFEKTCQYDVKERARRATSCDLSLKAPSTWSPTGVEVPTMTIAPSAPGESPLSALEVATRAALTAVCTASVAAPGAVVSSRVATEAGPLSGTPVQQPGGPSAQRFASSAAPAGSRTASTHSFLAAATTSVSSMQQLVAVAPVLMASATNQTRPPEPEQSRIPVPAFTISSRSGLRIDRPVLGIGSDFANLHVAAGRIDFTRSLSERFLQSGQCAQVLTGTTGGYSK